MLQARLFSYGDAQRYRLGMNFKQIPVNRPVCPVHSFHRDGAMRVDGNAGAMLAYVPNGQDVWATGAGLPEPALPLDNDAGHWDHRIDQDHWIQPGDLFRAMTADQRSALFENTARSLGDAPDEIKRRHIANCERADPAYGAGVAQAVFG
jgi:catalase